MAQNRKANDTKLSARTSTAQAGQTYEPWASPGGGRSKTRWSSEWTSDNRTKEEAVKVEMLLYTGSTLLATLSAQGVSFSGHDDFKRSRAARAMHSSLSTPESTSGSRCRGPGSSARPHAHGAVGTRACAARRGTRIGQDTARVLGCKVSRLIIRSHPIHARPAASRHHWRGRFVELGGSPFPEVHGRAHFPQFGVS